MLYKSEFDFGDVIFHGKRQTNPRSNRTRCCNQSTPGNAKITGFAIKQTRRKIYLRPGSQEIKHEPPVVFLLALHLAMGGSVDLLTGAPYKSKLLTSLSHQVTCRVLLMHYSLTGRLLRFRMPYFLITFTFLSNVYPLQINFHIPSSVLQTPSQRTGKIVAGNGKRLRCDIDSEKALNAVPSTYIYVGAINEFSGVSE